MKGETNENTLNRYYARVIEMGIRKISFYWLNFQTLPFLSSHTVNFMKELHALYNDPVKRKNLNSHFKLLKLIFLENSKTEEKIYELLIEEGYLSSMD